MNALRAVPDEGSGSADNARADLAPVEDDYEIAAASEPAADPEALLLCALMWSFHPTSDNTETRRIIATLTADDFDDVAYGRLFTIIADHVTTAAPYDAATIAHALHRSGADGAKDAPLRRRLNGVITAGAEALLITHYADIVLSQAYRRSFHVAGASITQAAEELPEEYLMEHMVEHGRRQRSYFHRLNQFRRAETPAGENPA
ncbi:MULTISPECIES: DnaB-like helicase N-terminal domain-containing protein [Nocardiaceae]|uniref:DnaB-like helicase N-terminal domain-containing protein n=1 Tax=Nocardiaceae TaxID=85025 RepID=UPI0006921284|nr:MULTISPECIES: DnaB-like helicase N-terminal domain-containing protein [Rhodococcus]OZD12075.1 DNA helicase [Rhodococcus sp. 06-156-4a]OZD15744.1 DNA helicase [Rhodococcus sp. 06-156-3C]OZD21128.1 DNA helicase [Rhodococcus sp. 06-156-4C]OZD32311.1 DNA helicase [Rhodococcus sp. 06-156-3]OZD36532.1 DNA helicase [Rhodococcus sp. 06-156-3b]